MISIDFEINFRNRRNSWFQRTFNFQSHQGFNNVQSSLKSFFSYTVYTTFTIDNLISIREKKRENKQTGQDYLQLVNQFNWIELFKQLTITELNWLVNRRCTENKTFFNWNFSEIEIANCERTVVLCKICHWLSFEVRVNIPNERTWLTGANRCTCCIETLIWSQ